MRIFLLTAYLVAVSTDAAPFGCGEGSSPPTVGRAPGRAFEIHISNTTDTPVYVDIGLDQNSVVSCVSADGTENFLFDVFCTSPCGRIWDTDCSDEVCDPLPRMIKIDAQNPLVLNFDGYFRVKNSNRCPNICIDGVTIPDGSYTLSLHTWTEYNCVDMGCTVENNIINFASPSGDRRDISLSFNAPRTEPLVFEIAN